MLSIEFSFFSSIKLSYFQASSKIVLSLFITTSTYSFFYLIKPYLPLEYLMFCMQFFCKFSQSNCLIYRNSFRFLQQFILPFYDIKHILSKISIA
jgi:hypothetical protein